MCHYWNALGLKPFTSFGKTLLTKNGQLKPNYLGKRAPMRNPVLPNSSVINVVSKLLIRKNMDYYDFKKRDSLNLKPNTPRLQYVDPVTRSLIELFIHADGRFLGYHDLKDILENIDPILKSLTFGPPISIAWIASFSNLIELVIDFGYTYGGVYGQPDDWKQLQKLQWLTKFEYDRRVNFADKQNLLGFKEFLDCNDNLSWISLGNVKFHDFDGGNKVVWPICQIEDYEDQVREYEEQFVPADQHVMAFINLICQFANKHSKRVIKMSLITHSRRLKMQMLELLPANVQPILSSTFGLQVSYYMN